MGESKWNFEFVCTKDECSQFILLANDPRNCQVQGRRPDVSIYGATRTTLKHNSGNDFIHDHSMYMHRTIPRHSCVRTYGPLKDRLLIFRSAQISQWVVVLFRVSSPFVFNPFLLQLLPNFFYVFANFDFA